MINALKPAQINSITLYEDVKKAVVVVDEDQLSLAIGKKGANVRLASKLAGWDIDILSEQEARERGVFDAEGEGEGEPDVAAEAPTAEAEAPVAEAAAPEAAADEPAAGAPESTDEPAPEPTEEPAAPTEAPARPTVPSRAFLSTRRTRRSPPRAATGGAKVCACIRSPESWIAPTGRCSS